MELDIEEFDSGHRDADDEHDVGLYSFCEKSHKDWEWVINIKKKLNKKLLLVDEKRTYSPI